MPTRRFSGITVAASEPDNGGDNSGGGSGGTCVDDVFSTYLYEGKSANQTIENGIDLDGEGGMVWIKDRSVNQQHCVLTTDIDPPVNKYYPISFLATNSDGYLQEIYGGGGEGPWPSSYLSNGFSLYDNENCNRIGDDYVSWTFRKAKNFFDVVTYTGNSVKGREIPHNLGVEPGMIIIKSSVHPGGVGNTDWCVYHNALNGGVNPEEYGIFLNKTSAASERELWNNTAPTDTKFTVNESQDVNGSGGEYVAYLFAHDDSDESIIKCGSFMPPNPTAPTEVGVVDLGWEPQWLLIKNADFTSNWFVYDTMRGIGATDTAQALRPNTAQAESPQGTSDYPIRITSTGFEISSATYAGDSMGNEKFIYMAIRRPTKPAEEFEPEELFAALPNTFADGDPVFKTGFPVDMAISAGVDMGGDKDIASRLTGTKRLETNTDNPEGNQTYNKWDYMDGFMSGWNGSDYGWLWRRAPGYFDVTCHTSNGQPTQQIYHNLGVIPEMAWIKGRSLADSDWFVHHKDITAGNNLRLNTNQPELTDNSITAATFTESYWTPGDNGYHSGGSYTQTYIAYLFATVPGISKVGSYTGNGSEVEVDCGFTNGARWALIKRTDSAGDWYFTSNPGAFTILSKLNTTDAQVNYQATYNDVPSGFRVTSTGGDLCVDGAEYIFYAIA